jgi:hypothetical protein
VSLNAEVRNAEVRKRRGPVVVLMELSELDGASHYSTYFVYIFQWFWRVS